MAKFKNFIFSAKFFYILLLYPPNSSSEDFIKYATVHSWADKFGMELWHLGDFITRRKDVQESFKDADVVFRDGDKIVKNMADEIKVMMDLKVDAVKRIMESAENIALSHQSEKLDCNYSYYSSKDMYEPGEPLPTPRPRDFEEAGDPKEFIPPKQIILTESPEFFNHRINLTLSSVHIPTNVYDRDDEVIKAIKWSKNLDKIFHDNYKNDPTLSWQFFGSSTGFMRHYPAAKWSFDPVDLYDCRLRSWYIEAATSPKDVIILMDSSGSMTGQRKDISKHVASTILDTLGTNDFVNIFTFAEEVVPIVECFRDVLVQATLENVRQLKLGLAGYKTASIANFTAALTRAFDILEQYRTESLGAHCNQAIMLISDGAPYNYEDIFEAYNWRDIPYKPVRVFTYLIGKEVADVKEIKWMACSNQGYYVHLSDLAEVREQVLNYIPVMARPLVLGRSDHPVIWTHVYADVVDPKMTDWLWEVKENEEQRANYMRLREIGLAFFSKEEEEKRLAAKQERNLQQSTESDKYHFVTTVAIPVYDRRENATRIANLLGVAGADVPIRDIKKFLVPFMLGVNGYAFIVTNNGYILLHPDFRPIFQDILKPAYNSVDMVEVELVDDDREPRVFNDKLLDIRDLIINRNNGSKWMKVKSHFDKMKRVSRIIRQYFWTPIPNTPFTLVITYPEDYGVHRLQVRADQEIGRLRPDGGGKMEALIKIFSGNNHWKVHPDWLYCRYTNRTFDSPEAEFKHFFTKMLQPLWKWPLNRIPLPPEHTASFHSNSSSARVSPLNDKDSYYCDRNLVQSLVFDARVTEWFSLNSSFAVKEDKGNEFKQRFGITVAFLATHSGLTRWHEFTTNSDEQDFSEKYPRAIDEIWYKRAVDQHFIEPQSFVYSVPFDAGDQLIRGGKVFVTASHAVFHSQEGKSAPAAVVGFQFEYKKLKQHFINVTRNCGDCKKTCQSEDVDCFVLDNHGYVLISPDISDTGKFFGVVRGSLMLRLVEENVYKEITIYDYQAICFVETNEDSAARRLFSPLMHVFRFIKWLFRYLIIVICKIQLIYVDALDHYIDDNYTDPNMNSKDWQKKVVISRTRPETCDHKIRLYKLNNEKEKPMPIFKAAANGCERPFIVMPIPASNLIILIVDKICPIDENIKLTTEPEEIIYGNATLSCFKTLNNNFTRLRPTSCINKHMNESSIELCGDANSIFVNRILILVTIILVNCIRYYF